MRSLHKTTDQFDLCERRSGAKDTRRLSQSRHTEMNPNWAVFFRKQAIFLHGSPDSRQAIVLFVLKCSYRSQSSRRWEKSL